MGAEQEATPLNFISKVFYDHSGRNNPPTYRKEIYQHESASGGNITQIGTVDESGIVVLNSQVDYL